MKVYDERVFCSRWLHGVPPNVSGVVQRGRRAARPAPASYGITVSPVPLKKTQFHTLSKLSEPIIVGIAVTKNESLIYFIIQLDIKLTSPYFLYRVRFFPL